jgi:hypothetical protein
MNPSKSISTNEAARHMRPTGLLCSLGRMSVLGVLGITLLASGPACAGDSVESWLEQAAKPMQLNGEEATLKIGLESRYRLEARDNMNLNNASYEDDLVNLFRNRLSADLKLQPDAEGSLYRFFVEGQTAQSAASNGLNKTNLYVNHFDLRQLYFEATSLFGAPLTLKAGRQELAYGDERFVGPLNWTNTARVFDAVKLVYNPSDVLQMDFFGTRVVRNEPTTTDRSAHADNFYGVYVSYKGIEQHVLDTFLFVRDNNDHSFVSEVGGLRGNLEEYTFGSRFKGGRGAWDYGTEAALQLGDRAGDDILAWTFHQELGYTFADVNWTPRVSAEYNHGSGDRDPQDGTYGTFDNLYPTNHNKYGLIDFASLKNMNDFMLGLGVKPDPKLTIAAEFHWLLLDAKESAWFNAGGAVLRAANVNASPDLGKELDVYATYKFNAYLSGLVGYSHFFAGPFPQDTGRGDDADFVYAQLIFKI